MTQVHFTLEKEEIQNIIETSVKDDAAKVILTTVFNQLMEQQRTEIMNVLRIVLNSARRCFQYTVMGKAKINQKAPIFLSG